MKQIGGKNSNDAGVASLTPTGGLGSVAERSVYWSEPSPPVGVNDARLSRDTLSLIGNSARCRHHRRSAA